MASDATTEKIRDKNKIRFNSRQAVRSNSFMSKEAPGGGKIKSKKHAAHSLLLLPLAPLLRFLSLSLSLSRHDAMNLSALNRTPVHHGTPSSLRAASIQTSLSTPEVRRSVGPEPCRAPNALKSSLKLFCLCCGGWPVPGSSPPPPLEFRGEQEPLRE